MKRRPTRLPNGCSCGASPQLPPDGQMSGRDAVAEISACSLKKRKPRRALNSA